MTENSKKTELTENSESVEQSQLLLLLNEEISEIQKEESRPGWTVWALFGGLATSTWLLLDQIENQIPKLEVLKIMLITITLFSYSAKGIYGIINSENIKSSNERLVSLRELFYKSKATLTIMLLWFLFIGYLVMDINIMLPQWALNCSYIGIVLNIIFITITLLISFFDLVVPNTRERVTKNKILLFFTIFYFGSGMLASIVWLEYLLNNDFLLIYEFKISLLIATIAILTSLLVSVKSSTQSLENLIELRRDLILGSLPISQIRNQTDLILRGLSIQDYYSKDINEILSSLQLFDKEIFQAVQKISLYKNNEKNDFRDNEKKLTQDALKESVIKHLITAAKIKFTQIDVAEKRLSKKRQFLKGFNRVLKKDFIDREIVSEVFDATHKNIRNFNDTVKIWHQLLNKSAGQDSAEKMLIELTQNVPKLKYNIKTGDVE